MDQNEEVKDESPQPKDRRTKARSRVERQMDNIRDLSESEREQILDKLIDDAADSEAEAKAKASLVDPVDFADGALNRMENWGKMVGLSSGYYAIDKMTMGFAPGELTIVAGETSQGKTLLCCNIAANMIKAKHKVVFVTLEMTKEELLSRLWKILGFGTDSDGCEEMVEACQYLRFQQIDRMDWKTIPYLIEQAKEWGAECVFIDHLHYFAREMHDMANELGIITQEFKQAAIKNEIPIVLISHTRKVEKGKNRADLNDLRGSSFIAQDADIVLMVWQKPSEVADGICIGLDKNRNRLDYRVGSEVWHHKDGLVIMDLAFSERSAADTNSVNYKPTTTYTTPEYQPQGEPPKPEEPAPWKQTKIDLPEPPKEEKHGTSMNGVIRW